MNSKKAHCVIRRSIKKNNFNYLSRILWFRCFFSRKINTLNIIQFFRLLVKLLFFFWAVNIKFKKKKLLLFYFQFQTKCHTLSNLLSLLNIPFLIIYFSCLFVRFCTISVHSPHYYAENTP